MARTNSNSRDEKRSTSAAVIAGIIASMVAVPITATILFGLFPPTGWLNDGPVVFDLAYLIGYFRQGLGWTDLANPLVGWKEATNLWSRLQSDANIEYDMNFRAWTIGLAAVVAALAGAVMVFLTSRPVDIRVHIRGRRFLWGDAAIASAAAHMKPEMRKSGSGIMLAPGLTISSIRELLNILLIGAPGSGKTRIILFLIEQILKVVRAAPRTTRLLIHDATGEIYRGLPLKGGEFAVIGLQRRDGWAWAIGRDVRNVQDATALAERLVRPDGKSAGENRVFDNGAVLCMTGCIELVRHRHGSNWGAYELLATALADPIDLLAEFRRLYPPAASVFLVEKGGDINRTSASFIMTFRANVVGLLALLATAWRGVKPSRYFSFTEWLDGADAQPGVVVLQRSARYARLSSAWMGAVLDLVAAHACDEEYNEDRRMRVYMVLDEIFQLQAAISASFQQILDIGRNKNVSTIAAYQDLNQARIIGGDDAAKAFRARFQTKIFGQMPEGDDGAGEVSRTIGERTIQIAVTKPGEEPKEKRVPVIDEIMIADRLGVIDGEVRAVAVGMGDVVELCWPVTVWPKIRPKAAKPQK